MGAAAAAGPASTVKFHWRRWLVIGAVVRGVTGGLRPPQALLHDDRDLHVLVPDPDRRRLARSQLQVREERPMRIRAPPRRARTHPLRRPPRALPQEPELAESRHRR